MTPTTLHKYVIVLGSCCTGDGLRSSTYEEIANTKLRLLLYQGRTSFPSLLSAGLDSHEFALTDVAERAPLTDWGMRMVLDEVNKRNAKGIADVVGLADALIIDHVSTFVFPTMRDQDRARYFLRSWEWDKYIVPRLQLQQYRLWDLPLEMVLTALRDVLTSYYASKPTLSLIFHLPSPAFNDGVSFTDPVISEHVDYYHAFCDKVFESSQRWFPRVSVVSPTPALADPTHANGPNPFHFEPHYAAALRESLEGILGVR